MPSSTTYHPYTQSLSALTEYLRQKLHLQRAKRLSRNHSAQVEQSVPLKHNSGIGSGLSALATCNADMW